MAVVSPCDRASKGACGEAERVRPENSAAIEEVPTDEQALPFAMITLHSGYSGRLVARKGPDGSFRGKLP
jgi:hypothetical protein